MFNFCYSVKDLPVSEGLDGDGRQGTGPAGGEGHDGEDGGGLGPPGGEVGEEVGEEHSEREHNSVLQLFHG